MPYLHRVDHRRDPKTIPAPREVEVVDAHTYKDRFGVEYEVVWTGHRDDIPLSAVAPNLLK